MKNRVFDLSKEADVAEWNKDVESLVERANNVEGFTLITGGAELVAFRTTHAQTIMFDGELLDEQQQAALKDRWLALKAADLVSCEITEGKDFAFTVTLAAGEVVRFGDIEDIIQADELFQYVLDGELIYEQTAGKIINEGDDHEEH